jgi:hypothetical protein
MFRRGVASSALLLTAGLVTIGCSPGNPQHLRAISTTIGNAITPAGASKPMYAAEGSNLYTLTVTLPESIRPDRSWIRAVLLDDVGGSHSFIASSYSLNDRSNDRVPDTFTATFEVPNQRQPAIVRAGAFDIDVRNSLIFDRRKAGAPLK